MKRYFIEEIKCGESEGGVACGPVSGSFNVSIKYSVDGVSKWLSNADVGGIPNFFLTEEDVFQKLCDDDMSEEFNNYMNAHYAGDFEGLDLGEYWDVYNSFSENPDNPAVPLVRLLVTLSRCHREEEAELIELATGKYIDEIDVPMSEDEEDWLADNAEDEEDT